MENISPNFSSELIEKAPNSVSTELSLYRARLADRDTKIAILEQRRLQKINEIQEQKIQFETAKNNPNAFKLRLEHKTNGYHTPSRTRYMYYDGKRIELDKNDPGGEHE